jgi:NAD(P)-dependent dehydrogenase (short-subunit alcohol dehydrogenase family)
VLEGKVAIVTGAARGLGLGIAETFAKNGAKVVIADLDREALSEAEVGLKKCGFDVISVAGNVADVLDIETMIARTVKAYGRLDILINNAGGSAHTPLKIEDVTEEHYDRVMSWNMRSTFFCIKTALTHLKINGGAVVNMASIAGRSGWELLSPQYSAAKAGIVGMTRNLARHLGPHNIRVNAIAPGFIKSGPRVEAIWRTRDENEVLKQVPLRKRGEIEDIAEAALYLSSDASKYVTGVILDVNGGFMTP